MSLSLSLSLNLSHPIYISLSLSDKNNAEKNANRHNNKRQHNDNQATDKTTTTATTKKQRRQPGQRSKQQHQDHKIDSSTTGYNSIPQIAIPYKKVRYGAIEKKECYVYYETLFCNYHIPFCSPHVATFTVSQITHISQLVNDHGAP